jgi:hypothetical protein
MNRSLKTPLQRHEGRADLIEAVFDPIVAGQKMYDSSARPQHPGNVRQGIWDVENMLERAAIVHRIVSVVQRAREHSTIKVEDMLGTLIV